MVTLNKFDDTRDRVLTDGEYKQLLVAAEGQDNEKNSQGNNTVEKDRIRFLKDIIKSKKNG